MKLKNLCAMSLMACAFVLISTNFWGRSEAAGYMRNSEIFNIGWIFSLPYDISNTLRAPLAGPLSIILTACLSVVLFFGMVASPVYYLFGTPKRKYHVNDAIQTKPIKVAGVMARSFDSPGDFSGYNETTEGQGWDFHNAEEQIGFLDSFFYFLPQQNENCKKLLVCHSHGFLTIFPTYILHIYRLFSRRTMEIPREYQEAIQIGLDNQENCARTYENCTKDPSEIAQETLFYLFVDPNDGGCSGDSSR